MRWDLLTAVFNRSSPAHYSQSGPFCFTRPDVIGNRSGHGLKHRKGLRPIGMPVPAASIPPTLLLIPEWKYGNLESHALRVTCQVPFTGLCYVTNICHRLSQTPHLRVKNANPGWRRGLVRHQLLNQSERDGGRWSWPRAVSEVGLDFESWVMLTGIKHGWGIAELILVQLVFFFFFPSFSCLQCICVCVCVTATH